MSASSFTAKNLKVTLILAGTNSFFQGTNDNQLILSGMRMSATVQSVARLATQLDLSIWGMRAQDMNALTVAWANPPAVRDHVVIVEADSGDGFTKVFSGTILEAQPDFNSAPDVPFRLQAITGYFQKINPVPPTSYPGTVPINSVVADLAQKMGFGFTVDGNVTAVLASPYLWGTYYDQLQQACQAANADFYFQGSTIYVTRANLPRTQQPTVVLNAQSGLIGYPQYERAGLMVQCLYNPAILCGSPVDIESIVPSATGRWYPYSAEHVLESRVPNGDWISRLYCLRVVGES